MIINLDLTGERFEIIYFLEGEFINLFFPYYPTSVVEFDVWGATLYLNKQWNTSHLFGESFDILKGLFSDKDDLYLAGRGHIKFEGVVSGSAHVAPYQSNKKDFAKNSNQSIAEYRHSWPEVKFYTETYSEITAPSFYPPQSTEIELKCLNGKVTFTFDTEDIITATEYMTPKTDYQKYELEKNLKKLEESYQKHPNLGK